MKKSFILFIVLIFSMYGLSAKQWVYVSPKGDDRNTGTREQPLASLAGARDRIRQLSEQKQLTDTVYVYVLPGDYYMKEPLRLTGQDGGTAQSPVIFTAGAVNRPVFYGGMKLNRFEAVSKNLWRVFVPEVARFGFYFEQLYVNGERRFRAQTPNRGGFYFVKNVEKIRFDDNPSSLAVQKIKIFPSDAGFLDLDQTELDDALVVFYHDWDVTRTPIQSFSSKDTSFCVTGKGSRFWGRINFANRYVVENYRKALDAPGEWYLARDGYLYYIPYPGETIDNTECIAPVTEKFLVVEGDQATGKRVEHIRFENLCFRVAGYHTPARGNEAIQAASYLEAAITLDHAKHIGFQNCEIAHTGSNAIWFRQGSSDCIVQHCHLYDLGAGGVKIGEIEINPDSSEIVNHITVDNNIIQHGGNVFPSAVGVIIHQGSDNTISHNDIADFRYSGVSVGWVWDYTYSPSKRNKIAFNHIHHLGWGELNDMGGVYTLGQSEGTTVGNNVIDHVYSFRYGGWGLYCDGASSHIVMENNLVYNCKNAGFHQNYGKENIVRNNIFAFNIQSELQFTTVEEHKSLSFVHNIVYFNKGVLYQSMGKDKWLKAITEIDYNCYWDTRTSQPDFHGLDTDGWNKLRLMAPTPIEQEEHLKGEKRSFREWQKLGKDQHSLVADPLFKDPRNLDFHFKSLKVARKIGFVPFDYAKAGVYGEEEWKKLA
ncbi:MAG: right-handed parallel beta-helix repeat-containing protein, partial [Bacteroidetes bacterium]|nr:right-handed parallel beta-helix repeat-containing protein [Bacteroidota bacterium]